MAVAIKIEKRGLARESHKTKRVREKLQKRLEEQERAITPHAIEQKIIEIHRWIARHAPYRVVLRSKNISLFDENQNTARLSRRVEAIAQKLQQQLTLPSKDLKERHIQKQSR